ncbi:hypothetical protein [Methylomonas sp. UP202]|uniref:hypothetical protein n=1 Tax=Methylomonas sp. UP202 TaxID=3040943 RepID=UPI00247AF81D|nr:hypothetical protein [Methylomonas sp. UP202]WGS86526.1 hypothetical protein QC632_01920 [Methylomonas sp. UP202]
MQMSKTLVLNTLSGLGATNNNWGICGINACMMLLFDFRAGPRRRELINHTQFHTVLIAISKWLEKIEQTGDPIKQSIIAFAGDFGMPKGTKLVWDYQKTRGEILKVLSGDKSQVTEENLAKLEINLPLPPEAVTHFLNSMYGVDAAWESTSSQTATGIIGVKSPLAKGNTSYGGLGHWIYGGRGKYYTWGSGYDSIKEIKPWDFEAVYRVYLKSNLNVRTTTQSLG